MKCESPDSQSGPRSQTYFKWVVKQGGDQEEPARHLRTTSQTQFLSFSASLSKGRRLKSAISAHWPSYDQDELRNAGIVFIFPFSGSLGGPYKLQAECAAVLCYILSGLSNLVNAGLSYIRSLFGQRLALCLVSGQRGDRATHCWPHLSLGKTLEPWQAGFPLTSGISLLTSIRPSSSSQRATVYSIFRRPQSVSGSYFGARYLGFVKFTAGLFYSRLFIFSYELHSLDWCHKCLAAAPLETWYGSNESSAALLSMQLVPLLSLPLRHASALLLKGPTIRSRLLKANHRRERKCLFVLTVYWNCHANVGEFKLIIACCTPGLKVKMTALYSTKASLNGTKKKKIGGVGKITKDSFVILPTSPHLGDGVGNSSPHPDQSCLNTVHCG